MQPVAFARVIGLDGILQGQQGVIRRDQALAAGHSRARIDDLVRRRKWTRLLPRVYGVAANPADPAVRLRATWLWAGDASAIAGSAAAWWWGLTAAPPTIVTVIVTPPIRRSDRRGITVVRGTLDPRDADFHNWLRVTTVARTCLDLARLGEEDRLETALRQRTVDPPRLTQSLERSRGRRGQVLARLAVSEVSANPWGFSERVLHRHLVDAGVQGWTANPPVRLRSGVRHPDVAVEDLKLAIEMDGREFHGGAAAFETDRARHNEFVEAGWTVLHFTWKQLINSPENVIATIRRTIAALRRRPPGPPPQVQGSEGPQSLISLL
jgi:very-short-patch-repair endonuclease